LPVNRLQKVKVLAAFLAVVLLGKQRVTLHFEASRAAQDPFVNLHSSVSTNDLFPPATDACAIRAGEVDVSQGALAVTTYRAFGARLAQEARGA